MIEDLFVYQVIRKEYEAVIPIDRIINVNIIVFKFDDIMFSIMISFEKKPDINGIPIKAILFNPKIEETIG